MAKENRPEPDALLAVAAQDLRMPGPLSGIDLVEKAREVRPATKSLLTSGFSAADVQRNAKSSGAPRVLSKPCRAQDLAKAINEALGGGSDYMR
jgi:DNA-binding NarL/FixJ family response regulator